MAEIEWKDIKGYAGVYQVSDSGEVRRIYKNGKIKILTSFTRKNKRTRFVKLTINGNPKDVQVHKIVAETFIGLAPLGYVLYHKNGMHTDNCVENLGFISRQKLGKKTGATGRRKGVAKINANGDIIEFYSSARECGKRNYMSYQTIMDRCNGKCKKAFAPDGYEYAWEDDEISIKEAIKRIEKHYNGIFIPKAEQKEMMW